MHGVEGATVDERSHEGAGVARVSDLDALVGGVSCSTSSSRQRCVDEKSPELTCSAAPPSRPREKTVALDREIHLGRRAHDHCVVAAELEDRAPEPRRDGLADHLAHLPWIRWRL